MATASSMKAALSTWRREFSLPRLAEQARMSEFHFNRLFKRATGVPLSHYQIKFRMEAARPSLARNQKERNHNGDEVGYSNPSHFGRLFRKETGLSP
jgi:AraC family transcriptional regulator